jgi:hypothetical protein
MFRSLRAITEDGFVLHLPEDDYMSSRNMWEVYYIVLYTYVHLLVLTSIYRFN